MPSMNEGLQHVEGEFVPPVGINEELIPHYTGDDELFSGRGEYLEVEQGVNELGDGAPMTPSQLKEYRDAMDRATEEALTERINAQFEEQKKAELKKSLSDSLLSYQLTNMGESGGAYGTIMSSIENRKGEDLDVLEDALNEYLNASTLPERRAAIERMLTIVRSDRSVGPTIH